MGSTGRNRNVASGVSNGNVVRTESMRLGDSVLLDIGNGRVSNMTVIDISDEGIYQLRPSNTVTDESFEGGGDSYNDMFVDADYIRRNRLENTNNNIPTETSITRTASGKYSLISPVNGTRRIFNTLEQARDYLANAEARDSRARAMRESGGEVTQSPNRGPGRRRRR